MADIQLMQVRDASQQLFQILVIDAMARIHLDAQGMGQFRSAFQTGQFRSGTMPATDKMQTSVTIRGISLGNQPRSNCPSTVPR